MLQEIFKLIFRGLRALFQLIIGKKQNMTYGEIGSAKDLQKKYSLYAYKRPIIKLNPDLVPEDLRDLIPMAEKWGINDDIIRSDFHEKSSAKSKLELKEKLNGRIDRINEWLDSFKENQMTEEAGAFMFMTLGADEMQLL